MNNTGFVAGTLVHTDKGLVPIQELKVGDKVLSRDEHNPDGELAYKRVLNTFVSSSQQKIFKIGYEASRILRLENLIQAVVDNPDLNDSLAIQHYCQQMVKEHPLFNKYNARYISEVSPCYFALYCTEDQILWLKELSWASISDKNDNISQWRITGYEYNYTLMNFSNIPMKYDFEHSLLPTNIPDVAVQVYESNMTPDNEDELPWVYGVYDFRSNKPIEIMNFTSVPRERYDLKANVDNIILSGDKNDPRVAELLRKNGFLIGSEIYDHAQGYFEIDEDGNNLKTKSSLYGNNGTEAQKQADKAKRDEYKYYKTRVYSIEVEDYHTYFVDRLGIWCHDGISGINYKKQFELAKAMLNSGFVAGTLVHTDKGLVPIQDIKVGDRVLTQSPNSEKGEADKAETTFKPVQRALKSTEKWAIMTPVDGMYCTENQLFWIHISGEDKPRWFIAEFISRNDTVHHISPERGSQNNIYDIYGRYDEQVNDPYKIGGNYVIATSEPKVALFMGFCRDKHEGPGEIDVGVADFRNGKALEVYTNDDNSILGKDSYVKNGSDMSWADYKFLDKANPEHRLEIEYYSELIAAYRVPDWDTDSNAASDAYTDYVYNLQVADTHTYFVGSYGILTYFNTPFD